ncbi:MAG: hypothetical protein EBR40_03185 [Proteobacteria bacterium]|nr:hypothetical protein [Pseudomonadota bacterium]
MPIKKTSCDHNGLNTLTETLYVGRVIRLETTTEVRNWSDTLDYTDKRSTTCTYALVYLGHEGKKPRHHHVGNRAYVTDAPWYPRLPCEVAAQVEALDIGDRFAWVDCTNLFSDRNGYSLAPVADTMGDLLLHCGVEVYDELAAWEAHHKAAAAARLAELQREAAVRKAAEEAEKAKRAARYAKKQAKEDALRAEAEALLARIPAKGTEVTIDGFTGKVFWVGVSKYYGKFNARAGVKDARGNVQWIDAAKF